MTDIPDAPRARFEHFSNEYAQALQAWAAIENQASTLVVMGHHDELRGFLDQFLAMATGTRELAREQGEPNFAEWFEELVQKAEKMRAAVAS